MESYRAALRSLRALERILVERPEFAERFRISLPEVRSSASRLHDVYFIALFARFESILRDYWRLHKRDSKPYTRDLIAAVAAKRGIPEDVLDSIQSVREFRNRLVHADEGSAVEAIRIDDAIATFNKFLSWFPLTW